MSVELIARRWDKAVESSRCVRAPYSASWGAIVRMLRGELARCQGFPDSYVLTGTQSNQVARIGNSVPPQVVEALIRANLPEACGGAA